MAESITYGSYAFPSPTPLVGYGVSPVDVAGKLDHYLDNIDIVGNLTGENLSGLHLQKMEMISGLMSEFQTLTISHAPTIDSEDKLFTSAKPESISFDNSDLTTVLPYSVSFSAYSSGVFSEFFGIENPSDTWTFQEMDGKITEATHNVSAKGVKVDSSSPLVNAVSFVTGRTTGCRNISLFQTGAQTDARGGDAFLTSRTENINKSDNTYSINEVYKYNTSDNPVTKSGVFTSASQIAYDKDNGLSVNVNASIQGSMDACKNEEGLVDTGMFTPEQATEIAVNAVASSLSDYESGIYTFINRGPKTVSYDINTGVNKIDFSYRFMNPDNLDQEGNVLHKKTASITASKDDSLLKANVQGTLTYNSPFDILGTGDPSTGARFQEVDGVFSGIATGSGFLNLAIEAVRDFRVGGGTGYHISGNFVNPEPVSKSITKTPFSAEIAYSVEFDNRVDLASGTLSGLKVSITDKKPIELSGIVPSLIGFSKQKLINRTAGEYSLSATCEASTGELQHLIDVCSGYATGVYAFTESSSVNVDTLSYNMGRYY
jgi:hypothetical protein